jgi:F-type H+-transporting ATPase subunit b
MMLALAENSIQLVPDGTLLFHLVLVVVMVAVLNRSLLRPINKVLEERERLTGGKLSSAEEMLASVREKIGQWERGLRDARSAGYRLLEEERSKALKERESRLAAQREELSQTIALQKQEIQRQEKEAQAALEIEARRLAQLIGSQILGRNINI